MIVGADHHDIDHARHDGTVARIRPFDGGATDPVLLVPMDAFVPDGGWGYAYLGAQPDRSVVYDVFGDGATPHQHVGDGWWVVG